MLGAHIESISSTEIIITFKKAYDLIGQESYFNMACLSLLKDGQLYKIMVDLAKRWLNLQKARSTVENHGWSYIFYGWPAQMIS